jgi:hypothetical protein
MAMCCAFTRSTTRFFHTYEACASGSLFPCTVQQVYQQTAIHTAEIETVSKLNFSSENQKQTCSQLDNQHTNVRRCYDKKMLVSSQWNWLNFGPNFVEAIESGRSRSPLNLLWHTRGFTLLKFKDMPGLVNTTFN